MFLTMSSMSFVLAFCRVNDFFSLFFFFFVLLIGKSDVTSSRVVCMVPIEAVGRK